MEVPALYIARLTKYGTFYRSRVSARQYLVCKDVRGYISVHVGGRCIYGGSDPDRAFGMMELDDCLAA